MPVYILNNEFADMMPDEEIPPPPNNGNPHPHEGPVAPGEPEQVAEWAENQMNQQGFGEWPIGDDQDDQNQGSNVSTVNQADQPLFVPVAGPEQVVIPLIPENNDAAVEAPLIPGEEMQQNPLAENAQLQEASPNQAQNSELESMQQQEMPQESCYAACSANSRLWHQ